MEPPLLDQSGLIVRLSEPPKCEPLTHRSIARVISFVWGAWPPGGVEAGGDKRRLGAAPAAPSPVDPVRSVAERHHGDQGRPVNVERRQDRAPGIAGQGTGEPRSVRIDHAGLPHPQGRRYRLRAARIFTPGLPRIEQVKGRLAGVERTIRGVSANTAPATHNLQPRDDLPATWLGVSIMAITQSRPARVPAIRARQPATLTGTAHRASPRQTRRLLAASLSHSRRARSRAPRARTGRRVSSCLQCRRSS